MSDKGPGAYRAAYNEDPHKVTLEHLQGAFGAAAEARRHAALAEVNASHAMDWYMRLMWLVNPETVPKEMRLSDGSPQIFRVAMNNASGLEP